MRTGIFLGVLLILLGGGMARADALYVTASSLNVRLCPKPDCPVADKLAYGTQVTVHERDGDWARVSDYTDAAKVREKHPDLGGEQVARWMAHEFLSEKKPEPRPARVTDKRILHMPRPGEGGLTAKDVRMLHRYAKRLLDSGACTSITNADKSNTRPGTCFVTCGNEYESRYFKPGQMP